MPGIELSLKLDDARVRQVFQRAPIALATRIRQLVEGAAIDVQREMRIQAPVAVTGQLRGSVRYSFNAAQFSAVISPNTPYASDVEQGTQPHMVSVKVGSSLRKWAELKGVNPYAVQKSIAKKGTKAHPFVGPTYNKMAPKVQRDVNVGISKLAQELDNGQL